ncbi:hypothetical protein ACTFIW_003670 [Dictyostelium discoideum]
MNQSFNVNVGDDIPSYFKKKCYLEKLINENFISDDMYNELCEITIDSLIGKYNTSLDLDNDKFNIYPLLEELNYSKLQEAMVKISQITIDDESFLFEFNSFINIVDDCIPYQGLDPFQWWINVQAKFPTLHKIAVIVLSFSASSANSERLFSCSGRIISKYRNNLSASFASNLIFLKSNSNLINKIKNKNK